MMMFSLGAVRGIPSSRTGVSFAVVPAAQPQLVGAADTRSRGVHSSGKRPLVGGDVHARHAVLARYAEDPQVSAAPGSLALPRMFPRDSRRRTGRLSRPRDRLRTG